MKNNDNTIGVTDSIFAAFDPLYEEIGLTATPIKSGDKKPLVPAWNEHGKLTPVERRQLREKYATAGIGLLAGTALSDGNVFGFLDCDHSGFTEFVSRVADPISGKIGQKGITIFCQFVDGAESKKFRQRGAKAPVLEIMASSGMTVVPPSKHPSGDRYRWHGQSLLDVGTDNLPVVTSQHIEFLGMVCVHPAALEIAEGGPDIKAHDLMS